MNQNENRVRLINAKNPVPTTFPNEIEDKSLLNNLITPRKPPTVRMFLTDEQKLGEYKQLFLNSFSEINEQYRLEILGNYFECKKLPNVFVFFKMESDSKCMPKVSQCIRLDKEMHVTLYFNNFPAPLLLWFRKGGSCTLTSFAQLETFPSFQRAKQQEFPSTLTEELEKIRYQKHPQYKNYVLRFSLILRYTSSQSYHLMQKEFKLPTLSVTSRLKSEGIDNTKAHIALRSNGSISENVIILFDEMYLQKCDQYSRGKGEGSDANGIYSLA